tara:strand:+ start:2004 stop:2450 length:447 start_codon:yes stop_codon:yes gene_type:complete
MSYHGGSSGGGVSSSATGQGAEATLSTSTGNVQSVKPKPNQEAVFDNYNAGQNVVSTTNEFDAVKGFFLRKTEGQIDSALALTDTVLTVSNIHGISPMAMIEELETYNTSEVQQVLISMINQTRGNTSILGYNKSQTPNQAVARNIIS